MKLKLTDHDGLEQVVSEKVAPGLVLKLCGGGYTEASTRKAMLTMDRLRNGETVKINGYTVKKEE